MDKIKCNLKYFLFLHIILLIYSISSICSKMAALQKFLSFKFIIFYGLMLTLLFLYAILWQQIIKKMPLTTAYANKSVTVIWGMIWGYFVFNEVVTVQKVFGVVIILLGIYLVVDNE